MTEKPFCRKCLIDSIDEDVFIRSLKNYISDYPKDKRCCELEYKKRIEVCKSCEHLSLGMCSLCGCYVELRALKINTFCPDITDKWNE